MENPLQSAIQKMGSNFLVAAFVPSMAFVIAVYFAFQPILPVALQYSQPDTPTLIERGVVLFLLATIIGFTLYSIGTYVYKAFEGYTFILGKKGDVRNSLLRRQRSRFRKVTLQKQLVQKELERIELKINNSIKNPRIGRWYAKRLNRFIKKQEELEQIKYELTSHLDRHFPPEGMIMPTRFGNLLRAAETYSRRYGIDAVPLWGRLVSCLPPGDDMMEKINEANNQCQFLLNGALLGTIFSVSCFVVACYEGILWWESPLTNYGNGQLAIIYAGLMVLSIAIARFFYEASLFNVGQFGGMIRASYDLYRFHLLDALHMELPATLMEEKRTWLKISHFVTGNLDYREDESILSDTMDVKYNHPVKQPSH